MRKAARAIIVHNQNVLLMKRNKFGQEFYTLVGGGINPGETADDAVLREVKEETTITAKNPKLVFIEEAGNPFGAQYIFVCEYESGEAKLDPHSIETEISKLGKNLYQPVWVPVSKFAKLPFRSKELQQEILTALRDGFPREPKTFTSDASISYTGSIRSTE